MEIPKYSRRTMLGSALLAATASATAASDQSRDDSMRSRFAFEANVTVATPMVVGPATIGVRRIVPITGGTVSGPRFTGRVVPGGGQGQYAMIVPSHKAVIVRRGFDAGSGFKIAKFSADVLAALE